MVNLSVDFWTLAEESRWNDSALQGVFLNVLSEPLKDELALRDTPPELNSLVSFTIRLDNYIREWRRAKPTQEMLFSGAPARNSPFPVTLPKESSQTSEETPMLKGNTRLTPEEKELCSVRVLTAVVEFIKWYRYSSKNLNMVKVKHFLSLISESEIHILYSHYT